MSQYHEPQQYSKVITGTYTLGVDSEEFVIDYSATVDYTIAESVQVDNVALVITAINGIKNAHLEELLNEDCVKMVRECITHKALDKFNHE